MELVPTWSRGSSTGGYAEVDWRDTNPAFSDFTRVVGEATSAESADVIKVISKWRQTAKAFVITNAVKVEGVAGAEELAESVEDIRSVNVVEMLIEQLDPDQAKAVRSLLAGDV